MNSRKNRQRRWPRRRGAVLALFAVLIFALLPLMALVIDLGIARVTRRQMQTAANTAALEGLRHRDDPAAKQREMARAIVRELYHENDQASRQFNGYLVEGTGTVLEGTNFRASPQIMTDDEGRPSIDRYPPDLQLNEGNAAHGDMVAGQYIPNAKFHYEETSLDEPHYRRFPPDAVESSELGDFMPDDHEPSAFLVRLRRVAGWNTGGIDNEAEVSSAGPPLPFLFGRGGIATGVTPDPAALWNQREEGITLRVTAIAYERPAQTVGPTIPEQLYPGMTRAIPGLAPVAVEQSEWNGGAVSIPVDSLDPSIGIVYGEARVANLSASENTLILSWAIGWPADPNHEVAKSFRIRIDEEVLRVTKMDDANPLKWTIERGRQGTIAATHNGARVSLYECRSLAESLPQNLQGAIDNNWTVSDDEVFVSVYDNSTDFKIVGFVWASIERNGDTISVTPQQTLPKMAARNASVFPLRMNPPDLSGLVQAPALVQTLGRLPP